MEWQPIETAPKDGNISFAWWPGMNIRQFPFAVIWDDGWWPWRDADRDYGEVFPTHWLPMIGTPNAHKRGGGK